MVWGLYLVVLKGWHSRAERRTDLAVHREAVSVRIKELVSSRWSDCVQKRRVRERFQTERLGWTGCKFGMGRLAGLDHSCHYEVHRGRWEAASA